jgi:F-type H+-transporting ATPase subunit c
MQIVNIDPASGIEASRAIGAWLAIGLAGLGAGYGEGMLVASAMDAILRNPQSKWKIMTFMILFLALVESVAIYGLIIAFQLLG